MWVSHIKVYSLNDTVALKTIRTLKTHLKMSLHKISMQVSVFVKKDSTSTFYKQNTSQIEVCQVSNNNSKVCTFSKSSLNSSLFKVVAKIYQKTSSIICLGLIFCFLTQWHSNFKVWLKCPNVCFATAVCPNEKKNITSYFRCSFFFLLFTEMYINQIYLHFIMFLFTLLSPTSAVQFVTVNHFVLFSLKFSILQTEQWYFFL